MAHATTTPCGCAHESAHQRARGAEHDHALVSPQNLIATIASGMLVAVGLACHWLGAPEWAEIVAFGIAMVAGGWFIAPKVSWMP